jgi:iron complex transport system substrate-binding protein
MSELVKTYTDRADFKGRGMNKTVCTAAGLTFCLLLMLSAVDAADGNRDAGYTLGIYGNANMDDTIDEDDIAYVKDIIGGTKEATDLADANNDGKVDDADVDQIEKIIEGTEESLVVLDSYNRTVAIREPVERIVSMSIYNNEALRMFGDLDKVVAIEESTKKKTVFFPQGADLPTIGGYPPNPEAVLKFQPDLVLGATSWTKEIYDKLPGNISIVGLDFTSRTPTSFAEETMKLGYIMNRRDEAKDYLENFQYRVLEDITSRTEGLSEDEKPKVYVESSFGNYKAYGGNGSGAQTYLELAGGRNIFDDSPLYFEADPEAVVTRNPDIIIKQLRDGVGYPAENFTVMIEARDEILSRPELADVSAIKNGQVYVIDEGLSYGFSYQVAVAYMAKWLHPELFGDLDPQALHQEFIDKYCPGLSFDVYKQGTFAYTPEMSENMENSTEVK